MQTLILRSNNKEALEAIRTLADVLDIDSSLKSNQEEGEDYIEKGVKITKPKGAFDPKKIEESRTKTQNLVAQRRVRTNAKSRLFIERGNRRRCNPKNYDCSCKKIIQT